MLDLRRDLYARLVLSAHKDKSLNKPFRVVHAESPTDSSQKKSIESTAFEKRLSNIPIRLSETPAPQTKIVPVGKVEKIDEKVEKIISDPRILDIKMELDVAEALLNKIKSVDKNNPKIPIIEQTIYRMKTLLEQKSYV